jgi:uncharacterized membrane protein YagU involved in acid resistance
MKPNVLKTMLGGAAGTAVMTMTMYFVAPKMLGQPMDVAAMLGTMMGNIWALGMAAHWMNGVVIFPLVYAFLLYKMLPGSSIARGAIWGVMLWLIAQVMVMPLMGGGFFSSAADGMMAVLASLMGHILYGGILGQIAGNSETA